MEENTLLKVFRIGALLLGPLVWNEETIFPRYKFVPRADISYLGPHGRDIAHCSSSPEQIPRPSCGKVHGWLWWVQRIEATNPPSDVRKPRQIWYAIQTFVLRTKIIDFGATYRLHYEAGSKSLELQHSDCSPR